MGNPFSRSSLGVILFDLMLPDQGTQQRLSRWRRLVEIQEALLVEESALQTLVFEYPSACSKGRFLRAVAATA